MKTRVLLMGGIIVTLILSPLVGMAASDACPVSSMCQVPAPTLIMTEGNTDFYANEVVVSGLSWNETLVDVYLDGVYNGRAFLNIDDSGVANFAYRPFLPLTAGEHYAYAVARNLSERERSIESDYLYFNVINRPVIAPMVFDQEVDIMDILPEQIVEDEIIENQDELAEYFEDNFSTLDEVEQEEESNEENLSISTEEGLADSEVVVTTEEENSEVTVTDQEEQGEVNVLDENLDTYLGGAIEGGVSEEKPQEISDLQETADIDAIISEFFAEDEDLIAQRIAERERQNRNIGLAMLAVIVAIIVVWMIVSRRERGYSEIDELFRDDYRKKEELDDTDEPLINMDNLSEDSLFTPPQVVEDIPPIEDEPIIPDKVDDNDDNVFRM
ncbi:MAG: hypothetical protein CO073_01440 [Candidatus Komeilibacteria bacterium CG_4_9_14_0_8_um_filter_36_9]|uniref:Bacterial Ig-like domain-containing protein n=1 Tax=Candidatus Komeilibacteria bacterium CG_4_9_14_0_8_um_filter_36_9 TaxID=1974473 RepID=A0A2M8DRS1_9BACT|nr:MAG: hypothetical protein CO073_01440 [Candidatus Komeilibacteria bacterium CG_4_9_14_0_8_um_filter_36_9]